MSGGKLDLQRIRRAIRVSGNETIFFLLDDAISLLPPAKLRQLLTQFMKPEQFVSDVAGKRDLLAEVQAFQKACLAREYYEAFDVNSKNCTQSSLGTLAWIADFRRLLFRCVEESKKRNVANVRLRYSLRSTGPFRRCGRQDGLLCRRGRVVDGWHRLEASTACMVPGFIGYGGSGRICAALRSICRPLLQLPACGIAWRSTPGRDSFSTEGACGTVMPRESCGQPPGKTSGFPARGKVEGSCLFLIRSQLHAPNAGTRKASNR